MGKEDREKDKSNGHHPNPIHDDDGKLPDVSLATNLAVRAIQTLVYVYGFITYPLYYAIQQPWVKREAFKAIRAYPVHKDKGEITYKPFEKTCPELVSWPTFVHAPCRRSDICCVYMTCTHPVSSKVYFYLLHLGLLVWSQKTPFDLRSLGTLSNLGPIRSTRKTFPIQAMI